MHQSVKCRRLTVLVLIIADRALVVMVGHIHALDKLLVSLPPWLWVINAAANNVVALYVWQVRVSVTWTCIQTARYLTLCMSCRVLDDATLRPGPPVRPILPVSG